jgi:tripartite-type tricarboxylate transporter receptor subunit TctC
MNIRSIAIFAGVLWTGLNANAAMAQSWPEKPVKIVIGYAPGGSVDTYMRMFSRRMEERFKQPFIVENRTGASQTLATAAVAQAPADGYTISLISMPTQGATFHRNISYDIYKDFEPLAAIYSISFALAVNSSLPINNVKELVAYAKANPGKLNIGAGVTTFQLFAAVLRNSMGLDMVSIPYKGAAPALTALMANEIQVNFDQPAPMKPVAESGKIRLIGMTSEQRIPQFPAVPTFAESGYPQMSYQSTAMVWGRKGFPKEAAAKINAAMRDIVKTPEFVDRIRNDGGQAVSESPDELWQRFLRETKFMEEAAKAANFQPE